MMIPANSMVVLTPDLKEFDKWWLEINKPFFFFLSKTNKQQQRN